jgi:hypothetical protein
MSYRYNFINSPRKGHDGAKIPLSIIYDSRHFTGDRNVTMANFADRYSFLLWICEDHDF